MPTCCSTGHLLRLGTSQVLGDRQPPETQLVQNADGMHTLLRHLKTPVCGEVGGKSQALIDERFLLEWCAHLLRHQ